MCRAQVQPAWTASAHVCTYNPSPRDNRPLTEMVVDGIRTNIPLHQELCQDAAFLQGGTDIHYLEKKLRP